MKVRRHAHIGVVVFLAISLLALSACGHKRRTGANGGPMTQAELAAYGMELYALRCQACHGPHGQGDGPAAPGLQPKPRNYADKAWQDSVDDRRIVKAILEGGAAVGKSQAMPPQGDLRDDPEATAALVKTIRSFRPH